MRCVRTQLLDMQPPKLTRRLSKFYRRRWRGSGAIGRIRSDERYRDFSATRLLDRAKPQLIHMVVEAPHGHCPGDDLKPPNSIKPRPSTRLNYAIWRSIHSEGILFGLARDKSAVGASPDYAVENENRYSVLLSLDYIPSLSDFAYQVTSVGKRNRGLDLAEIAETPKTRRTRRGW